MATLASRTDWRSRNEKTISCGNVVPLAEDHPRPTSPSIARCAAHLLVSYCELNDSMCAPMLPASRVDPAAPSPAGATAGGATAAASTPTPDGAPAAVGSEGSAAEGAVAGGTSAAAGRACVSMPGVCRGIHP